MRAGPRQGLLGVYSLSKRSNLAGYRAGFVTGDPALVAELLEIRRHAGLMMPGPVQAAMTAALADDRHADEQRARYAAPAGPAAGRARRGRLADRAFRGGPVPVGHQARPGLLGQRRRCWPRPGILVAPGEFYGPAGRATSGSP